MENPLFWPKFTILAKKYWKHDPEWFIVHKFKRLQNVLDAGYENCTVTRLSTGENEMESGQVWAFAAQFVVTLSFSVAWLIFCRILRSMRIRIGVTLAYLIAAAVALLGALLSPGGPTLAGFIASALVIALLYFRWRRSLKMQSLYADTIIGFELT